MKLKCYTNISYVANKLYVRGIDENNNRVNFLTDFNPTVWVSASFNYRKWNSKIETAELGVWKSFIGKESMVGLRFKTIEACKDFLNQNTEYVVSDNGFRDPKTKVHTSPPNPFVSEYIARNFSEHCGDDISVSLLKIYTYDIETEIGHRNVSDRSKVRYKRKESDGFAKTDIVEKETTIAQFETLVNKDQYQIFDEESGQWVSYDLHPFRYIGGFPNPINADERITLITVKDVNQNKIHTFGLTPFTAKEENITYYFCSSEKELLESFLDFWSADYPDIAIGFNGRQFDNTYLYNRISKVLGIKKAKKLSPIGVIDVKTTHSTEYGNEITETTFGGICDLDYLKLYRKFTYKNRESYKLDSIAEDEVGIKKIPNPTGGSFKDFYTGKFNIVNKPHEDDNNIKKMGYVRTLMRKKLEENPNNTELLEKYKVLDNKIVTACKQLFVEYNIRDVQLIDKIEAKQKLVDLAMAIAYLAHCNIQDVFSPVKVWEYLIFYRLYERKEVIPIKKVGNKKEKFAGAYVKPPLIGKHEFCESFDLDSLYPHIIQEYNISPETLVRDNLNNVWKKEVNIEKMIQGTEDLTEAKELGFAIPASGVYFSKSEKGLLPSLCEELYSTRKAIKKQMLNYKSEHEKVITELRSRGVEI